MKPEKGVYSKDSEPEIDIKRESKMGIFRKKTGRTKNILVQY